MDNMKRQRLTVSEYLKQAETWPVLDVRSPAEFEVGHIPSAISFPLFSNEERAVVGTLYKQEGRQPAIKKGLEIIGPKMVDFIEQAEQLESPTIALYCWRGGMRSDSMAWLLERYGFQTILLEGGYKAYRNAMLDFFKQALPLRVIAGYTGSQKTRLLHILREKGEQVVDLEGMAGHQGSSFGNQKCKSQPTTEQFQNQLFHVFRKMDLSRSIWIEDEDMRIGTVNMTEGLFRQINASPHIFIEVKKNQRIDFLVKDYGMLEKEKLIKATHFIRKRLGYDRAQKAIAHIREGDLKRAVHIILNYYDSRYDKALERKKHLVDLHLQVDTEELEELADELIKKGKHEV
jgi:tRNA 2-selenouridine synthase